jgi:hypothetical protein
MDGRGTQLQLGMFSLVEPCSACEKVQQYMPDVRGAMVRRVAVVVLRYANSSAVTANRL